MLTPTAEMVPAALSAVRVGLARLESMWPVQLAEPQLVWVGHSLGGTLATVLAAGAVENGLPATAALMAVEPGGETRLALGDLSGLPSEALVLLVVGDRDVVAGDATARSIRAAISHMPDGNVDFVTVRSDDRTVPALVASHVAPLATVAGFPPDVETGNSRLETIREARAVDRFPPDALDYYGYWKLLDGLLDAAFSGANREYALGGTTAQRFMGVASDGVAVTQLVIERGAGE
jgi:pimeloyl-ACP methyl ester carboxylesterase